MNGAALINALGKPSIQADALILLAIIAVYAYTGFRHLDRPGLYGDEAWAAIPAARFVLGRESVNGIPYGDFKFLGRTFPYMGNDGYIGPFQLYIIAGGFALFGINPEALRATTGFVGLLGVLSFYYLLKTELGRVAAAACSLLLATDLTYVLAMKHDWGSISAGLLFRGLSLILIMSWWRRARNPWKLFAAGCVLGTMVAYRVDFLAFVAGAVIVLGFVAIVWLRPRISLKETALSTRGFLIGAFPILLFNLLSGGKTFREGQTIAASRGRGFIPGDLASLWSFVLNLPVAAYERLEGAFSLSRGTFVTDWILKENVERLSPLGASPVPIAAVIAAVILLALIPARVYRNHLKGLAFILAVFALASLFLAAVPIARGPHHVLLLYPLPHLLIGAAAGGVWEVAGNLKRFLRVASRASAVLAVAGLLLPGVVLTKTFYDRLLVKGGSGYWSEAINQLTRVLKNKHPGRRIVLLDWGIEQPVEILSRGSLMLWPAYWRIMSDDDRTEFLDKVISDPLNVFVKRSQRFEWNRNVHREFEAALQRRLDLTPQEEKIYQYDGEHAFTVVRFHRGGRGIPLTGPENPRQVLRARDLSPRRTPAESQQYQCPPDIILVQCSTTVVTFRGGDVAATAPPISPRSACGSCRRSARILPGPTV